MAHDSAEVSGKPFGSLRRKESTELKPIRGDTSAEVSAIKETPTYFSNDELTQGPVVDGESDFDISLPPDFPQVLMISILISESGAIDDIETDQPVSEDTKEKIKRSFQVFHFFPGRINGVAVKSRLDIRLSVDNGLLTPQ